MELRQLRYALAVAEKRSFTQAAKGEHVVQSALSQQVRKLEQELGVSLFDRSGRSVTVTPAGEVLLPAMRRALEGIDDVAAEAQAIQGVLRGRIAVGMMESPPEELQVAKLVASFRSRYPDISISVRSGSTDNLIRSLREHEIDAALMGVAPSPSDTSLRSIILMSETLVAVIPEAHELAGRAAITLQELASHSFIDFPRGSRLRNEADRTFGDLPREVTFEVTGIELVFQFVRFGLGIALLPESVARVQRKRGGLWLAKIDDADLTREVCLTYRASPGLSAVGRAFVSTVSGTFFASLRPGWLDPAEALGQEA